MGGEGLGVSLQGLAERVGIAERLVENLLDALIARQGIALRQVADAEVLGRSNMSRVRAALAGQNRQQAALAGAVGADKADTIAWVDVEGDVFEELLLAQLQGDGM
jgi:hypothetical protein